MNVSNWQRIKDLPYIGEVGSGDLTFHLATRGENALKENIPGFWDMAHAYQDLLFTIWVDVTVPWNVNVRNRAEKWDAEYRRLRKEGWDVPDRPVFKRHILKILGL